MSDIYELSAEVRTQIGKGENRRLRRLENKVPAIIYGGDKKPETVVLDHNKLTNALENEAFYSHILTLSVAGKKEKVVLKDLHRHPSEPRILHADFLRVNPKTELTMQVPLHFVNAETSPGVKTSGGVVSHLMSEVEVKCLPGDLPEFIEVDLGKLNIGDNVHLSELKLPKNVKLVELSHGKDQSVASIHKPLIAEPELTAEEEVIQPEAKPEGNQEA